MKLLHLADLHIGKRVHEFSMLKEQRAVLEQIQRYAVQREVDAVVIAGDVYDKPVPSGEAVDLFDGFLTFFSQQGIPVLLIAGNHDSGERLDFAHAILQKQHISICGRYTGGTHSVCLRDEFGPVRFHLLPYLRPNVLGQWHELAEKTSQCAVEAALGTCEQNPEERHVLLAHAFVTCGGALPQQSDSEIVPVGGLDAVDAALFAPFDYVALGHLHRPQRLGRDSVRYAGSPLKYSFSEQRDHKTVPLVALREAGQPPEVELLPLRPLHDLRELRGTMEELLSLEGRNRGDAEDYLRIVLTDERETVDAIGTLREVYPNLMQLVYDNSRTRAVGAIEALGVEETRRRSTMELFEQFFLEQNGRGLDEEQRELLKSLCGEEDLL